MQKETKYVILIFVFSIILAVVIFPLFSKFTAIRQNITPDFCKYPNYCNDVPESLDMVGWPFVYWTRTCCSAVGEATSYSLSMQFLDYLFLFFVIFVPIFVIYYIIIFLTLRKHGKDKKTK